MKTCKKCTLEFSDNAKFCASCGGALDMGGKKKIPTPTKTKDKKEIKGLEGWLYFVALGLLLTPFLVLSDLLSTDWQEISEYIESIKNLIYFEQFFTILLGVFAIYLIYLFAKMKKIFPKLYIIFLLLNLAYVFIDFIAIETVFGGFKNTPEISEVFYESGKSLGRGLLSCLIWIPYMIVSKRVKNTFVNF